MSPHFDLCEKITESENERREKHEYDEKIPFDMQDNKVRFNLQRTNHKMRY